MSINSNRVAVAMSGGMDSTAAAFRLKQFGFDVVGIYMVHHDHAATGIDSVMAIAEKLGIPLNVIDLRMPFREIILEPFIVQYSCGITPSPCPVCNKKIKTEMLLPLAASQGCDLLATGHYADIVNRSGSFELHKGVDNKKDQSYFLFQLDSMLLSKLSFPNGKYTKGQIATYLREHGFNFDMSQESQELCFLRKESYRDFLEKNNIMSEPGPVLDTSGKIKGQHRGISNYTIGQRKGLGICGPIPLYVIDIDAAWNTLVIGSKEETYSNTCLIEHVHWLAGEYTNSNDLFVKIRSASRPAACKIIQNDPENWTVNFRTAIINCAWTGSGFL